MRLTVFLGVPLFLLAACGSRTDLTVRHDAGALDAGKTLPDGGASDGGSVDGKISDRVFLFGGLFSDSRGNTTALDDTWVWNGRTWSELTGEGPSARGATAGAVFQNGWIVMGGTDSHDEFLADSWSFDGSRWTQLSVTGPSARALAMGASAFGKLFVMGGVAEGSFANLNDMWTYDGASWSQLNTQLPGLQPDLITSQAPQVAVTMGDSIVMFGGIGPDGLVTGETWRFDGHAWQALSGPSPNGRLGASVATFQGKMFLYGGYSTSSSEIFQDTWLFDGTSWKKVSDENPPGRRLYSASAERNGAVVLFGGEDESGRALKDTWEFDGTNWTEFDVEGPSARFAETMTTAF